jgi:hypothetical protein
VRTLLKLAVVACSVAASLAAVEYVLLRGVLGRHGIVDAQIFEHDSQLGWRLKPGVVALSSAFEYAITVRTDAMGLRVEEDASAQREVPHRVLVVGDSFAFGWGVEGDETFAARLQEELVARGLQASVLNAGVPGYSTDQEFLFWRRLHAQLRPEVVILLVSSNDPPADSVDSVVMSGAIYSKPLFSVHAGHLELRGVPVADKQPLPTSPLEPLRGRLRPFATYALARQFNTFVRAPRPSGNPAPAVSLEAMSSTRVILGAFNRELGAAGGRLLVALIPSPTVRDSFAKICEDEGVAFLDLEPTFAGRPDLTFKYDGHWNALGHAAAASAVVTTLLPMLQ